MFTNLTSYIAIDYLHFFVLDPANSVFYFPSFLLQNVNVLHQTMAYMLLDHQEVGRGVKAWIELAQDRVR